MYSGDFFAGNMEGKGTITFITKDQYASRFPSWFLSFSDFMQVFPKVLPKKDLEQAACSSATPSERSIFEGSVLGSINERI